MLGYCLVLFGLIALSKKCPQEFVSMGIDGPGGIAMLVVSSCVMISGHLMALRGKKRLVARVFAFTAFVFCSTQVLAEWTAGALLTK